MPLDRFALALALVLAAPASAREPGTRAEQMLQRILLEGRVIVTCFSLDTLNQPRNIAAWDRRVAQTLAVLETASNGANGIAAFRDAARVEVLRPTLDESFADVEAFCGAQSDVMRAIQRGSLIRLPGELEEALTP